MKAAARSKLREMKERGAQKQNEYEVLQRMKDESPEYRKIDKGGVYNYLITNVAGEPYAIDDDYLKGKIMPINYMKLAERQESGLYVLRGQTKIGNTIERVDHEILPVYLAGIIGVEETIDPETEHYILIKRSYTGIPKRITDEKGKEIPLNFSLALVVKERPELVTFKNAIFRKTPSPVVPEVIMKGEKMIPIVYVRKALENFTETFCNLYPELSKYYPFSPDFMYKGG